MARLRALAIAAGLAVASGGLAGAADLLPPIPSLPSSTPAVEDFSGWYLRGDVGAGINAAPPDLEILPDPRATGVSRGLLSASATQSFNNSTLSSSGVIDFGVGYQFNSWFRMDGTLEYRGGATLQSLYTLTDPVSPVYGPLQYGDFYRGDVASYVGLINGYLNIGTYAGISPFVGAGIGFSDNMLSGFTEQGIATSYYGSYPAGGYYSNGSKTSFAWALMAGLDFNISPNLKFEFGYRYLNIGSIGTGQANCLAGAFGGAFNSQACNGGVATHIGSRRTLASNDIRLGLIWLLGAPATPISTRY
jgi:opacity protein-like surface antigen